MENDNDIIPASELRIRYKKPAPVSDALYSSPFDSSLKSVEAPLLKPDFQKTEAPQEKKTAKDSVSTGTFGNLVRKVNREVTPEDRVAEARQRIRFNLMKVGPRRKTGDRCEAWRKYLF